MVTENTVVATLLHTSPVTGVSVDVVQCVEAIRAVAPDCMIIVDGIQHAAHGGIDLKSYDVDGYVISPYKVFSRHGYGVAWISSAMSALPHNNLIDGPGDNWEMGTRDAGAYAALSDVVGYFEWLGEQVGGSNDRGSKLNAAADAIRAHERTLTHALIYGIGKNRGLADIEAVAVIGGIDNPAREGLVSFSISGVASADVVRKLNDEGIRSHLRKADHYSGNILDPLHLQSCIRVSMCHYNSTREVSQLLDVVNDLCV